MLKPATVVATCRHRPCRAATRARAGTRWTCRAGWWWTWWTCPGTCRWSAGASPGRSPAEAALRTHRRWGSAVGWGPNTSWMVPPTQTEERAMPQHCGVSQHNDWTEMKSGIFISDSNVLLTESCNSLRYWGGMVKTEYKIKANNYYDNMQLIMQIIKLQK